MGRHHVEHRTLGRTGLSVSAVGFGGGGIGQVWGPTTDAESIRAVRVALERGVTFFDVAPGYGGGRAERVLGEGVAGRRDDVTVMTKVALPPERVDDIRAFVRESVTRSLGLLRTDHVDVLLVHNMVTSARGHPYSIAITLDDAMRMADAFEELRAEGRVRYTGFTAWRCTAAGLDGMFGSDRFDAIQTEYNLLNPTALLPPPPGAGFGVMGELEADHDDTSMAAYGYRGTDQHLTFARAEGRDLGVVGIRPLMGGVLADEIDREVTPDSDLARMRRRADAMRELLGGERRTLSGAAIRFCLQRPEIDTVVPGVKNVAEIEDAIDAAALPPFTDAELARIAAIAAGEEDR
jgi:aryl-alcohol dehydrogenase-like predicted oxidoreductase